jgi:hypothetical protein
MKIERVPWPLWILVVSGIVLVMTIFWRIVLAMLP